MFGGGPAGGGGVIARILLVEEFDASGVDARDENGQQFDTEVRGLERVTQLGAADLAGLATTGDDLGHRARVELVGIVGNSGQRTAGSGADRRSGPTGAPRAARAVVIGALGKFQSRQRHQWQIRWSVRVGRLVLCTWEVTNEDAEPFPVQAHPDISDRRAYQAV